jgi:hypothetical protein
MKERFVNSKFSTDKLAIVKMANTIIASYQAQGLRLTLRQLYYQFISERIEGCAFPNSWIDAEYNTKQGLQPNTKNTVKNYKRLGGILSDGRLAGLIDWDAIEDRVRVPKTQAEWDSITDLLRSAFAAYRLPRWKGQECYCELWVEKDALAGVLEPMAHEFHVTLMVNKGYSSQSAMYEAAKRFIEHEENGQTSILYYLGDHDPSGEDMVRDIRDRLHLFGSNVRVQKLALTMDQVQEYNPPPNPAKMSDSRAAKYVDKHGSDSWEVDALPPEVMHQIIRDAFSEVIDTDKMDAIKERENRDKAVLTQAAAKIKEGGN